VQLLKKFGFIAVILRVLIAGDDLPEKWELDRPLTLINDVNSVDNKWPEDHSFNAQLQVPLDSPLRLCKDEYTIELAGRIKALVAIPETTPRS